MNIIKYPDKNDWLALLKRPAFDSGYLEGAVESILNEVKMSGDEALRRFTLEFDKVNITGLGVSTGELDQAGDFLTSELKDSISVAKGNIEKFHSAQRIAEPPVETMPGVQCWRKTVPIEKVGLYIPGGSAPLFSTVLMLAIPARLAGCKEIILCSPPNSEGRLSPAILYAAKLSGITKVFRIGGAQAIAAMSYGTASVPRVHKIFGPGNQYVTCAKVLVQKQGVAIDLPAGPSEVAVYADEMATPAFIAADLLSQSEHGPDSQSLFVTCYPRLVNEVIKELERQLERLPRKEIAKKALEHCRIILVKSETDAIDLLNEYAPEHLILSCMNADILGEQVKNAGSVFLGNYSPESAGDYATGTNHTLPTNGHAKAHGGIGIESFVKKISFQKLSAEGLLNIAGTVEQMAEGEGLLAHANAVRIRKMMLADNK